MSTVTSDFLNSLVNSGSLTTALAVQTAAEEQVNTALTGSTGVGSDSTNPAWGKPIPVLIGHTRTVCLPLWQGNAVANINSAGDETDTIDFAVIVGRAGPSETGVTLLRIWFDNVLVYDSTDSSVTTLTGSSLTLTFYDGTQVAADPTILAANGDATPAFTGTVYLVFPGLLTRFVSATATTTQFSKLPEVQVEIEQVAANGDTGVVIRPFEGAGFVTDGYSNIGYYSTLRGLYYWLTSSFMSIYDIATNRLLGRTAIFASSGGSRNGSYVLSQRGLFIYADTNGFWTATDPITGAIVGKTKGTDKNGINLPQGYGALLELGGGFFVMCNVYYTLVHFDGTDFAVCNCDGWHGFYEGTATIEYNDRFTDIQCEAIGIAYECGSASNILRRIVLTAKGDRDTQVSVGVVTADGSNKAIMKGTSVDVVLKLEGSETFRAVMMDHADNTRIYAIVVSPAGTQIRCYATFYYWNPASGKGPDTTPAVYGNYDTLIELSRINIPEAFFNTRQSFVGIEFRDKRYTRICYYGVRRYTVLNFKTGNAQNYYAGYYYNSNGDIIAQMANWSDNLIILGNNDVFLCPGMESFAYGLNEPILFPAKIQPKAVTGGENAYTLAELYLDISVLAGYSRENVTCVGMESTITGLQLNQTVSYTDLMAQLNAVFRVDMIEKPDGSLLFNRRVDDRVADYAVTPDKLLPASGDNSGNTVAIDRVATNELPTLLQLSFINQDFGFVVGAATVRRVSHPAPTAFGASFLALSIPVVMGGLDAQYFAGVALFDMWAGKMNFQINLPPYFFFVEPGDFVELIRPSGRADLCKITEIILGTDRTIAVTLSGVGSLKPLPYYQNADKPTQVPVATLLPLLSYGTLTSASPLGAYLTLVDNVGIQPGDTANADIPLYFASNKITDVYVQLGGEVPLKIGTTAPTPIGITGNKLPATAYPYQIDNANTITLTLLDASLPYPPPDANGLNVVLVGAPGRWEAVSYAKLTTAGTLVILSGLRRARLGTGGATSGHETGDLVLWAPAALLRGSLPVGRLGAAGTVYGMPAGKPPAKNGGIVAPFSLNGAALLPLAPLFAKAVRQGNGDVVLSWYRQDRASPATFYDDPPNSEVQLLFAIGLPTLRGSIVAVRTVNSNATNYTYTAGDQATDGTSTLTRLFISIAQISTLAGVGAPFKDYVNVQ